MQVILGSPWIELRYNPVIHAKLYVAMGEREADSFALFGSGNLTAASIESNIELAMLVYSEGIGRELLHELHYWANVRLRTLTGSRLIQPIRANRSEAMDFKTWFCLNQRESFTIDPKINPADARLYFGQQLDDRMRKQITRAFVDPRVPKMMVYGPYGSGKTQTLCYLAHWLKNNKPESCKGRPFKSG